MGSSEFQAGYSLIVENRLAYEMGTVTSDGRAKVFKLAGSNPRVACGATGSISVFPCLLRTLFRADKVLQKL